MSPTPPPDHGRAPPPAGGGSRRARQGDVVVPLERRRGERRGARPGEVHSPEVLALLRLCGAPLRAGDEGDAASGSRDRRSANSGKTRV